MATLEQVEKLREKANVTYNEAKAALEACEDDLLDAVIYLERQGKVNAPQSGGCYNSISGTLPDKGLEDVRPAYSENRGKSFSQLLRRALRWCGVIISTGNRNSFEVRQGERVVTAIPVTILVLLLLSSFWLVVPLMIIGFFFNFRYVFKGPELEKNTLNRVIGSAAGVVDNIRQEISKERGK